MFEGRSTIVSRWVLRFGFPLIAEIRKMKHLKKHYKDVLGLLIRWEKIAVNLYSLWNSLKNHLHAHLKQKRSCTMTQLDNGIVRWFI